MKRLILLVAGMLLLGLVGCAKNGPEPDPVPTVAEQPALLVGPQHVPLPARTWADSMKREVGAFRRSMGDWDVYLITMGEQPAIGPRINLEEMGRGEDQELLVGIRYVRPGSDSGAPAMITYPYLVFTVPKGMPVTVRLLGEGPEPQLVQFEERT